MSSDDVQHHLKRHLDERMPLTPTLLPTNDPASPETTYHQHLHQPHPPPNLPKNILLLRSTSPPNPNPPIPPLMANIIATPDLHRQAPPIRPRARAADFFSPTIESLLINDSPPTPPSRPDAPPPTRCPSPLIEDPSSQHFPSQDRASTLESFRLKYQREFDEPMNFDTFSTLADSFAQEALTLARELTS